MKKKTLGWMTLALSGALLCAAPGAMAREGGDKGGAPKEQGDKGDKAGNMLKALTEHLQLSAEQQEKIKPIIDDMLAQVQAAKKEGSQEKASAARKAGMDKIAEQLTPEQKAKFDKHRASEGGGGKKDKGDKPKEGA